MTIPRYEQNKTRLVCPAAVATVTKPPRSRLSSIFSILWIGVNSPIVLWALSALIIAIGSAYFTGMQQCSQEAEQARATYYNMAREIYDRQRFIVEVMISSKDVSELQTRLKTIPFSYAKYKDLTLSDLTMEWETAVDRVNGLRRYMKDTDERSSVQDQGPFSNVMVGILPLGLKETDLANLRQFAQRQFAITEMRFNRTGSVYLIPRCNYDVLLDRAIGRRPPVLDYGF